MRADWKEKREGFRRMGKRKSVPEGWNMDRERAGIKGGEFRARDVQAEKVRCEAKRARGCAEVE